MNKQGVPNDETRKWIIGKTDYEYCLYRKTAVNCRFEAGYFWKVKKSLEVYLLRGGIRFAKRTKKVPFALYIPVTNNNKELEFMLGYGLDITNLKQKEILIKQNVALENAPIE